MRAWKTVRVSAKFMGLQDFESTHSIVLVWSKVDDMQNPYRTRLEHRQSPLTRSSDAGAKIDLTLDLRG